jgi:hypothetical protein
MTQFSDATPRSKSNSAKLRFRKINTLFAPSIGSINCAIALIAGLLCATAAPSAHSASLERLGDGRIVLTALGERLAFREKDAGRINVYWPPYPCDPKPRSVFVTLALWLDDPKVAECLNRAIPDGVVPDKRQSMTLQIYLGFEDGRGYRTSGKRPDQPLDNVPPLYPGGIKPEELPEPPMLSGEMYVNVRHPYAGLECLSPVKGPPDTLGYEPHGGDKSPPNLQYTLPPDRRADHALRPLCVGCSRTGNSWDCAVIVRSSDKAVSLSLQWFDWDFHGPRSTWLLYDAAARKIAQSIFIDRAPGDLQ